MPHVSFSACEPLFPCSHPVHPLPLLPATYRLPLFALASTFAPSIVLLDPFQVRILTKTTRSKTRRVCILLAWGLKDALACQLTPSLPPLVSYKKPLAR